MIASWQESYYRPNNMLKSRHPSVDRDLYSQGYSLPSGHMIVEKWTIKNTERHKIDVFKMWCWRRLLRVPWTVRRLNKSILKEINPEFSLEGPMLKLKFQYFGHLMWIASSLENSLMLGKIENRRIRGHQRMKWLDSIPCAMDFNVSQLQEMVRDMKAWHAAVHRVSKH